MDMRHKKMSEQPKIIPYASPQVVFIFHDMTNREMERIASEKPTILLNHENVTVIDFRSGLIYKVNGEQASILSFRSTQQTPPGFPFVLGVEPGDDQSVPDYVA
jgi:hypothetical protein